MHAEVRVGDTVVMLGDAGDNWPAVPAHLHVYVDDVDATYRRALQRGPLGAAAGTEGAGPRPPWWRQRPGWQHLVDCNPGRMTCWRRPLPPNPRMQPTGPEGRGAPRGRRPPVSATMEA